MNFYALHFTSKSQFKILSVFQLSVIENNVHKTVIDFTQKEKWNLFNKKNLGL